MALRQGDLEGHTPLEHNSLRVIAGGCFAWGGMPRGPIGHDPGPLVHRRVRRAAGPRTFVAQAAFNMATYRIATTRRPRGFVVTDAAGVPLCSMVQRGYFSRSMEGTVGNSTLRIAAEGMWRMRYGVFLDGVHVGGINTSAWGQLVWSLHFPDKPMVELQFVSALWRHCYILRLSKEFPLLEVHPLFKWSTFNMHYRVQVVGAGMAPEQMPLLLALVGFSAALKQARAHTTGAH